MDKEEPYMLELRVNNGFQTIIKTFASEEEREAFLNGVKTAIEIDDIWLTRKYIESSAKSES